jgi:hypothetical protein
MQVISGVITEGIHPLKIPLRSSQSGLKGHS